MTITEDQHLLEQANAGIRAYLETQRDKGLIAGSYYEDAVTKTVPNLRKWLLADELDRISPNLRKALRQAIRSEEWEALANAFSRDVAFVDDGEEHFVLDVLDGRAESIGEHVDRVTVGDVAGIR